MVPSAIRVLDDLPLTANGKVDRKALAQLEAPAHHSQPAASVFETRLAKVWAETLALPDPATDRSRSFFELGGHSLLALRLLSRVEKEFGIRLPVVSLFHAPTIAAMASLIERRSQSTAAIFPIQPEGSLPPFFCVGATPLFLGLGSRLSPERPFLGLAVPTNAVESGARSLEELAGPMAAAIRERQPQGPYVVGGWCVAGVLAYEIARQLEHAGAAVQLVVLLDSPNPAVRQAWFAESPRRRWLHLMAIKAGYHLTEITQTGFRGRMGHLADRVRGFFEHRRQYRRLRNSPIVPDIPLDYDLAFRSLIQGYTPQPIRARVLQIRPARRPRGGFLSDGLGWEKLAPQFEIAEVSGNHGEMLLAPHVESLAGELNSRLQEG